MRPHALLRCSGGDPGEDHGEPSFLEIDLPPMELPESGEQDDAEGLRGEAEITIDVSAIEGDPFDDSYADDLPIDVGIDALPDSSSALGDDSEGLDHAEDHHGIGVAEDDASFLDEAGHAEEGVELEGDPQLGIDPIPNEDDDGGIEGLEDPDGDQIDHDQFPPLDGADDDDDELLDVGFEPSSED